MTRMFLSLGKTHGVMAKEIVGMLYREAGLPDGCLGRITLFPKHSLVDVPEGLVGQVMERTRNARLRGRTVPHRCGPRTRVRHHGVTWRIIHSAMSA